MKLMLHFYTVSLSLTLNNASASLSNGDCLGTLNLKLPITGWKVFERTYLVFQKKNKEKRFSQLILVHVRIDLKIESRTGQDSKTAQQWFGL